MYEILEKYKFLLIYIRKHFAQEFPILKTQKN